MLGNKLVRQLNFTDLFFSGTAYMIGVGIFTLMPYIIKYGKNNSVLAFIIGGVLCAFTGLSFSRLNYQYPVNDAEYSWIREILKKKGDTEPSKVVNIFASVTIWIVGIIGVFSMACVSLGMVEYVNTFNLKIPKIAIILTSLTIPTIINMIGVKSVTNFAKIVICLIVAIMVILIGSVGVKGKKEFILQNTLVPQFSSGMNLLRASFLTIETLTGFQSVVQLSEEAENEEVIPHSITSSVVFTTILYALLVFSVIAIIGLSSATKTVYPVSMAYQKIFGARGRNIASGFTIITMFSAMIILILSMSRLFHKLAVKKIAPGYLSKLVSLDEIFKIDKSTDKKNKKEVQENFSEEKKKFQFDKLPIPAIISLFVVALAITFIKGGVLELVANFTNTMLALIFSIVNLLVIINYHKYGKIEIKSESKLIKGLFNTYPWYAVCGFIVSIILCVSSYKFYDML